MDVLAGGPHGAPTGVRVGRTPRRATGVNTGRTPERLQRCHHRCCSIRQSSPSRLRPSNPRRASTPAPSSRRRCAPRAPLLRCIKPVWWVEDARQKCAVQRAAKVVLHRGTVDFIRTSHQCGAWLWSGNGQGSDEVAGAGRGSTLRVWWSRLAKHARRGRGRRDRDGGRCLRKRGSNGGCWS